MVCWILRAPRHWKRRGGLKGLAWLPRWRRSARWPAGGGRRSWTCAASSVRSEATAGGSVSALIRVGDRITPVTPATPATPATAVTRVACLPSRGWTFDDGRDRVHHVAQRVLHQPEVTAPRAALTFRQLGRHIGVLRRAVTRHHQRRATCRRTGGPLPSLPGWVACRSHRRWRRDELLHSLRWRACINDLR